jgi:hypothetical protein
MIHISGAFVYQPSSSPRPDVSYPATFLIKLVIVSDDGAPVFNSNDELLERLRAFVVLGYPQVTLYNWPLTLTNLFPVFNAPFEAREYFQLRGVYDFGEAPQLPPPDWIPAAIWVDLDGTWGAIIQAAAPAVPNSRIATPVEPSPPVAQ